MKELRVKGPMSSRVMAMDCRVRNTVDRFGIPKPRKSGSVIVADRQRFGSFCVLLKRVPQGRTESGGIVLAANAGPRVPSGGVTLKRRCTYRHSVIYLLVNKLLSLSLCLSSLSHPPAPLSSFRPLLANTGKTPSAGRKFVSCNDLELRQ